MVHLQVLSGKEVVTEEEEEEEEEDGTAAALPYVLLFSLFFVLLALRCVERLLHDFARGVLLSKVTCFSQVTDVFFFICCFFKCSSSAREEGQGKRRKTH